MAVTGTFVMPQFALRAMTPVVEEPAPSRPGEVTFGLGISDQEVTESFDTVFPLAVPKNGLLFLNPKLSLSDELDARVSVGIGYRHLFPGSNVILGANLFYDNFDSAYDHRINQFGAGIEVLTRWVDFRANFYLPEQDRRTIAKTQTVTLSRKASESAQALGPRVTSQSLAFQGNNILQNTMGANDTLHTVSLRETETTHFWERYEAGMRGGDAEIGFLIPGLDRYADVRVFGGYYFYENDFGKDVNGFKGRIEVRALPAVTFDAMYYDDKEVIGSNWFYGMRISAPFDLANMSNHRSPFAGFTEAFKPKSQVADEKQLFANRMTENIMRTSRVTTSESKFIQTRVKKEVYEGKSTYVTSTTFSSSTILTLGGVPITVTHVDSNAAGANTGTFESPYITLTLANADPVKRNIVFLHADSIFNNQSIDLAAGQQLLGDAANVTHFVTSDQGTLPLPHANGTAAPIITNPGGALINVTDNTTISGVNLSGAQRGIYAAAGATNVTITNSTISNMTIAGIEIVPSNNTTIDGVTFNGNATDIILNAFNTTLKNLTSNNATNGAFKLSNTTGTTTITNVTVNNAAVFGLQINNPGGTHNITNLDITGGTGSGVEIIGGGGTFAFDSTSSVTNTGGVAFKIDGGTSAVTYNGTLSENNNAPLVSVLSGHTGTATFNGTLTATNGQGLLFDNADGTYNFLGTTTLNGGDAGIDIVNGSGGTFAFGAGTAITNPTGQSLFVNGGTASLMYAGTIADNTGAAVEILNHTTGTISFLAGSTIAATGGTGLQFSNDGGTYNFLGTATMNGGNAGIDIITSNGTFNFGANTTVTNPTGTGFFLNGGQANVTYSGNINDNSGFALQVINHSVGTLTFNTGTVTSTGSSGVQFVSDSGIYNLANVTVTNSGGAGLEVTSSPTGTFSFGNLVVTSSAGTGVQLNNAGAVSILGGSINGTGGNGIFSQNTALTVTGTSIGNNVALTIAGIGIEVQNLDGTPRVVNLSNNNIRSTGSAIQTTDNGVAGGLTLILNGNTYETLAPGSKALNITGSGTDSTTIRSMTGGTVVGNGNGGGLYFTRVTFDGDAATAGNQVVSAGAWNIGQGVGARVFNDGLHLDGPTGVLGFTTLNIFNNAGTGLFVDTKALATTFALGNTGGVINTTGGAAMDIDPLTTNLTFTSVTSTNSGTSGVIVDTLASGSSLTIGTTTVSNSAGDGIVVRASAGSTIGFGTTTVTNAGQDAIDLGQAGNANITFGATTINGFGAANSGVNFAGSDATVTFGVTTIQNGGNGTGIDLSSTQNGRVITFATGSAITNVAIGVQLSSSGTTATSANANFTFGDGSGVDANGRNSTINAPTTVAAIGLNPALGSYNFQDVNFTGTALFPAAAGALFVSSTAVNGVGDGSFANPYSVSDADAITTAGSTFAFLDGTYNFATLNAGASFSLSTGQAATGLDNGNVVAFGTIQPANITGDFGILGGSASRTGGGTLSITNGSAGGGVFSLFGGNNVTNITVTGEAGAVDPTTLFSSNGLAGGFDNTAGITLSGVTIGNLQAGSTALAFSNMTGSVQVSGNNINTSAGTLFSVTGGTANYTLTKGATGTLTGTGISVTGTTGGSVAITGATLNTAGNTAVTLNGNAATVTLTDLAVTRTAGDTAFNIDATAPSTGAVTVNGASTLDATAGSAFLIGAGGRNINASALNFSNAGTTAANVIRVTGQTGGTISFGNVGITGYNNGAGIAVSLAGTGGNVTFGDLDIAATDGDALTTNGVGLSITSASTISADSGRAVALTNVVLGAPLTFTALTSTNSTSEGVLFDGVSGAAVTVTGNVTVNTNGLGFDAVSIVSSSSNFDFQGTTAVTGAGSEAISLAGANGTVAFNTININASGGRGVEITNATNDVTFGGGTIGATTPVAGITIRINDQVSGTIAFTNVSATAGSPDLVSLAANNGTVTFTGGTYTKTGLGDVLAVESLGATGIVNFGGTLVNNGGAGSQAIELDGVAGTVNVTGNYSSTSTGALFAIGAAATNTGTITISGTGTASGGGVGSTVNDISGTGSVSFTGGVSISGTTNNAIGVTNVASAASVTFSSVTLSSISGDGVNANGVAGQLAINGGSINGVSGNGITLTNTNLTVGGAGLLIGNTAAVSGRGIDVTVAGANTRTVSIAGSSIKSTLEALRTTDSATGTLNLALNGNAYETTTAGPAIRLTGAALNSTIVRSMNGGTVVGNNTGGGILFDRVTFDSDALTAGAQQVSAGVWNVGQGVASRVVGNGVNFQNPTGDLSYGTLNIFNSAGTGLLVNTKTLGTTFALGNGGGTVDTSGGTAFNLDPLTTNLTFGTVTSTNSGGANPGFILDAVAGTVTVGTLNVTNAGGNGLVVQNSSAMVTFTNIAIDGAGADGIHLANNTGSFNTLAGGATTINNTTGDGIDLTGETLNPTVNMLGTVGITRFGGIGVNFTGASVTAAFGVTTINNIANGSAGTAIDLSSTTGTRTITFAAGSAISNVAVGVQIGATAPTAANANFVFGDGTSANGLQSSISATTTVAALGLDPVPNAPGVYNFNDVNFTGTALFPNASGSSFFVSSTAVNGVGDGSLGNPYSVADANAITGTATFAFLDGTYNFASLGASGFTLAANQSATGLDNGNSVAFGTTQPNRVLGNFSVVGGFATRANTGNGTLSITNGTAAGNIFTLSGSNGLSNITLTGEAGATDPTLLIFSNGASGGFNNAAGITLTGVTMGNVQAGSTALSFTAMTGSVTVQNNNINASGGSLLNINGGTGAFTIAKGTGTTLSGQSVIVTGTTGGSVQITGAALATVGNTAVTLNDNAATTTFTDVAITRSTGTTAYNIDAGTASTGAVTINGTSSIDSTAGRAFLIGAGARNINASALSFTNAGTTTGSVIAVSGQTGGTISFGNVGITGYNVAGGTAVSLLGSGGTVSFGDLDITTAVGSGLSVGAITFNPGSSPTISATGGSAMSLNGTTLGGAGATFVSLSSTNSAANGVTIATVSGNLALGNVSVTNAAATGLSITGSSAVVTAGTVTVTGAATGLAFGVNTGGSFTATGATSLTGITGTGINANTADGTYTFAALTVNYTGAGRGIDLRGSNVQFETNNLTITGNGAAGSIGLDLSGTLNPNGANSATPNILLAKDGGETAAISNVATGVKLGEPGSSAGAYLKYGSQVAVSSGSSISVTAGGITVDTTNLVSLNGFTQGRYEFTGVAFTGQATFEGTNPNFIFVGTNAAGSADGSNPSNRISTATFLASDNTSGFLAGKTIIFVNDNAAGIDLAGATLNLGANTSIRGFGNGATVTVTGGVQPVNVIGDNFVAGGGSFTDAAGAATVHNNAGVNTVTLNTGNTLSNFILGNGGTSIFGNGFGTLTITGMVINNTTGGALSLTTGTIAAGSTFNTLTSSGVTTNAVLLSGVGGSFSASAGSITNATGAAWSVIGGTVGFTYSGNITQASNAALVSVTGGHSAGTITFNTGTLSASNGTGLQFNDADGTYNFNGTTTLNGGDAGIDIVNGSSGTFDFSTNTSITNPTGTGFTANGSAANVTYRGNITKSGASAGLLVDVTNETGGTITFQTGTLTSTSSAGTGINLTNSDGTVNFNGTTTLNGGNSHVDINTGSGGTVTFSTGASINSPTGTAFVFNGSTANVTYSGNITQANSALLVDITDQASGTITFQTGTLNATDGAGVNLNNVDGTVNFNGTTTLNGGDAGVDVLNGSNGNITFSSGATITNPSGVGLNVNGGTTGTVAYNGTISKNTAGFAVEIQSRTGGTVTVGGNLSATSASTGLSVHNNTGGTVTFSGTTKTISTGGNTGVTLATNTGSTVNFTNGGLVITTTTGTGFSATGGGTIGVSGANNTLSATSGTALNVNAITSGGMTFRSASTNGAANGMSFVNMIGGSVTITGDGTGFANGSGGTITNALTEAVHMVGNSGTFTFTSMNFAMNTSATDGILVDNNAGGTITVNVIGSTFTGVTASVSQNKALLQYEADGAANVTANVQNTYFNGSRTYGFYAVGSGTSVMNVTVNQSGFGTNVNTGAAVNRPGTTITNAPAIGMAVVNGGSSQIDYVVSNNTFWGASGSLGAIYAVGASGTSTTAASRLDGSWLNNRIGLTGVTGSGASGGAGGMGLLPGLAGSFRVSVIGNDIRQVNSVGINFANTVGGGATITATGKFKGNTIAEPDTTGSPALQRALVVSAGNSGGANNPWTVEIGDTTGAVPGDRNNFSGAWQVGNFVRVSNLNNTAVLTMPGLTPVAGATAAQVNAFVQGANNFGAPATGSDVNTTVGAAGIVGGAPLPLLFAAGGQAATSSNALLTQTSLNTLGDAAISLWSASGLSAQQTALLHTITFSIGDLAAGRLAEASGTQIVVSANAAGNYWFIDSTPQDNSEFVSGSTLTLQAVSGGDAAGRVDALSVLLHDIGHVLGYEDGHGSGVGGPLMDGYLHLGERLLPTPTP